jgi:hypothetical protein
MLELSHVLLCRRLFRERPRQHEFGLEYFASALDDAVQRGSHPADYRVARTQLLFGRSARLYRWSSVYMAWGRFDEGRGVRR